MPEEKKRSGRKVNAWIPDDLYFKVDDLKYRTWTEAIVSGLELLVKSTGKVQTEESEVQSSTENSTLDDSRVQGNTNKSTVDDLEVQKVRIESTGEIRELRARVEGLQDHNETLKTELEKAGQREEDLKETHRNYMLQVQTLINQKAIEAPGAKKPWWQFW
jgi:chromosome segregation ATPase